MVVGTKYVGVFRGVHYDFGLRNILSVLRTLGAAKRVNQKDGESTIVMRVLRDMNLSKLIDEDEPLFNSLVSDLFPTQSLEKTAYPELEDAISVQVEEASLVNHAPWQIKLIQVGPTSFFKHGIMILGPTGAGKTTCIHTLMKALTQLGTAITAAQMFGRLDVATNDWTDGIFSALWRKTLKLREGEYVWLVLDGQVDSIWIENLNSVLDDNKTLTLANGDRLSMAPTCKIIFEPHNIDNASPATVSRNGMVYMSSSGLNWKPVVKAWLKTRTTKEQEIFYSAFHASFNTLYTWVTQNLVPVMNVLQCNVTLQILNLLEGTGRTSNRRAHIQIVRFRLNLGHGIVARNERSRKVRRLPQTKPAGSRPTRQQLQKYCGTVFDYVVNSSGEWELWSTRVSNYVYPELATPDYANILIPITDNVRMNYLIDQGSAKTVMIKAYMKKANPENYLIRSFNFSSATSPYQERMGNTFGPPGGKKMITFIDDINLPEINCWGDQITNEILREPGEFTSVVDLQFVAAMSHPGGGRNDIPSRLKRHFCIFNCPLPSEASIDKIFRFTVEVRNLVKRLIPLTRLLWSVTRVKLLPTPAKFHYVFSLRDLSRIWQGMVGTQLMVVEISGVCRLVLCRPDAPEPTGEEGEEADMELPKVYEPVTQFNEMVRGSGMDLVFFPDAMLHLVKISRVIRHPRGNVMLVGVGGSGKQSLTKLSTFIAGYKSNFLEDIKALYRSCGCQAKGTTFIFTDLDIKEEGFLEYLNNILSSGVISNLFTKDEQSEIVQELSPIMRRENPKRTLNPEVVMEYFMNRTCQNLHVVLCFSPVGEKFRSRAMRFPALISGCTLDWFQPWPKDALVSVAHHFVSSFDITCTDKVKQELVVALGSIQDIARDSRTPKSYLNFIAGYKSIYQSKREELSEGALRMDTGLEKLAEASASVEILKKKRASQAEIVKNQVQIVKEKAEILVSSIAEEKGFAEEKLEAAKPALEEAEAALNTIKPAHIATVRKLGRPPHLIMRIMDCVLILFQRKLLPVTADMAASSPKPSWADSLKMMASTTFLLQLQNYPKDIINDEMIEFLQPYFEMEDYNMDTAKRVCGDVAGLLSWTKAMAFFHGVNKEVLPLKIIVIFGQVAMEDLAAAEWQLEEREQSLREVKEQYDKAVMEKQRLTDAANSCLRKMNTATTLINGLGGEKVRWTQQSKEFKEQLGRLVGDVLLATGFLSYCGPYNQEYRTNLVKTWMYNLELREIPYTSSTVSQWTLQGLPNDDLSVQNALIVTKARSYPLLIDPQTQGKMWIKNKEANNNLQITSLEHKYFRTHLEDCLSLENFIKSGSIEKVIVGDKECDVLKGFMLYITTKHPNPPYSPEISAKTSIIDFTVTMLGLEDQLLGRVILMEKSDLEDERVALFESVMQNQCRMKELETNLLSRLNSTQGSLVDDEELIEVLEVTKVTSEEVNQKLSVFRAVAARGSILYFLIVEMSNVNVMYQNSLKQFLGIFDNSITKSTKSTDTEERITIILQSLYERHKALFTLMMAMKIDLHKTIITHEEFLCFIKGGASLDLNAVRPKPFRWILDITWLNLVEIQKLNTFSDILTKIEQNEKEWRSWYEREKPEEEEIPCGYQNLWTYSLGTQYGEPPILDLEVTWSESSPEIPLICILSIGSDPSPQILSLAKTKDISGGWVLLQNVHLSLPFASEVMTMIADGENMEDSFRLWLTTEVHEQFPIGLLQMSIKYTNEPPQGIRASMKRTYQNVSQDFLDYSTQPQWPPLLYAVAFLHTVVQERRKFGPLGWNVPYEFNQADFAASVQFIQNHLDDMDPKKGVSWPTVLTDDFDKRLLTTFTQVWFCDILLRQGFEFYKGYKVPQTRSLQGYIDYINGLPATDIPEVFGLHGNADITYQINSIKVTGILDTIVNVQPKEGGGGGGETRESIVYSLAKDMLEKLPKEYNSFEVKEALQRMGPFLPINIFLRQEIDRIQMVIKKVFIHIVRSTLCDLKLAIDGTIVMSNDLRKALDSMYDARIPDSWLKVSWESATLGFWYTELLERDNQFRIWCSIGKPNVFWMTGFFNPQGFLTAMRQDVTRAHKGWALDSVVLQNLITRYSKEDIKEAPSEGVYIHGLFLEGASLDRRTGKLIESKPKVLYEQMPVIYIYAINTTAGKDPKLYECPIYRKPQRTDQKYVGSIDFETDYNARHWTLRGVALLCDIK
ncbi:hypothetical protein RI129_011466 [Pyrocoelia pectoralis]|uniref:Dynein heavy chain n=1 Tax=Pyrocoelia pectoralis TaxID=417401 RepID=A0AAN7ZBK6_9COLE